jgi:hypothetical protein
MKKDKMKKKMMGYKAGGLQMVEKDGKKVPFYAADGKGKMMMGGKVMGYKHGGAHLDTSSTTIRAGKTPDAKGLKREAEVSDELDAVAEEFRKKRAARKAKKAGKKMMGGKVMGYKEGKTVKADKEPKMQMFLDDPNRDRHPFFLADPDRPRSKKKKKKVQPSLPKTVEAMAGGMMKKKMMGGGKVMGYKHGGKHGGKTSMPRGCGVATRQRPAKMVVMKGS